MFFTNGCAVEDFNWPDRIILGTPSSEAVSSLKQIFHPLVMRGVPVLVTNYETAELTREATTAFLANKISFINELASLCEHVNADAVSLARAMWLDKETAAHCLQHGAGMGAIFTEQDNNLLTVMVKYCESAYGVAEGVDALVVATGWPEFRTLDFARIRHLVKQPIIIDTKNLLDSSRLRAMGFQYMGVGRG